MSEFDYEKKYNELMSSLQDMHKHNVKKTNGALKSLLIIPTIFLILLFLTKSSKTVFLVLWLASILIIAAMLIVIEYQDYNLKKMMYAVDSEPEPEAVAEIIEELEAEVEEEFEEATEDEEASAVAEETGSEVTADN